jgi:hypothetical protein
MRAAAGLLIEASNTLLRDARRLYPSIVVEQLERAEVMLDSLGLKLVDVLSTPLVLGF